MELSLDLGFLNAILHDAHSLWMSANPHPIFEQGQIEIFIHPSLNTIVSIMARAPRYIAVEREIKRKFREKRL